MTALRWKAFEFAYADAIILVYSTDRYDAYECARLVHQSSAQLIFMQERAA